MKIKLITPKKAGERELFNEEYISFIHGFEKYGSIPLSLTQMAAVIPNRHQIEIIDENLTPIDFNDHADLVGITFNTMLANRAYRIADAFRQRGVRVVLGGIHATILPDEAKEYADVVVTGESEQVWPQLIHDLENNTLQPRYHADTYIKMSAVPTPACDLVDNSKYLFHVIQTSRGCPHDCEFCSVHAICGRGYRYRPVEMVLKDIAYLQDLEKKLIFFSDDNFISNRKRAVELLRRLADKKISFFTQCDINVARDAEMLNLLAAAGCRKLFIGFESVCPESLASINKDNVNRIDTYYESIEAIQSQGIEIMGGFILGLDYDTDHIFEDTLHFIQTSGISYPAFSILTPYPGTRLFERIRQERRLLHTDWERYDGTHVCFQPHLMSVEELQEGYYWLYEQIFSYESIFQRMNQLWMLWNENKKRHTSRLLPLVSNLEAHDFASKLRATEYPNTAGSMPGTAITAKA